MISGGILLAMLAAAQPSLQLSSERLHRLDQAMQSYVDDGKIAGAVVLLMQRGKVVHQGVYGWADKSAGKRLTGDAIFRIASQSKAITSVAAMILVEEGRLGLMDPVSQYLPNFANSTVATKSDTGRSISPARRAITIRDLLTHTAGISYGTDPLVSQLYEEKNLGPAAGYGWYTADKAEPICETMDRLGTLPFVAQPGESFVYGYGTDVLGCVIERVSGQPLDRFFQTRIFGPLGMTDTYFYVPATKASRLVAVHRVGDGGLVRADTGARGQGHYVDGPRRSFAGGAGLVSTARDYGRFLQMLLNGGELDGYRLLSPTTVRLMTTNHVGTLFPQDGQGFSLGFMTVERAGSGGSPQSVGSYGWGGAYSTSYAVDPAFGLVTVLMTQHLPNGPFPIRTRFTSLVYQALVPVGVGIRR
jgi:CubicO group peptidase (beta-lactamase class C family)